MNITPPQGASGTGGKIPVYDENPASPADGSMWAVSALILPFVDAFTGNDGTDIDSTKWPTEYEWQESGTLNSTDTKTLISSNQVNVNISMSVSGLGGLNKIASPTLDFTNNKQYRITFKTRVTSLGGSAVIRGIAIVPTANTPNVRVTNTTIVNAVSTFLFENGAAYARKIENSVQTVNQDINSGIADTNLHTFVVEVSSASLLIKIDDVQKYSDTDANCLTGDAKLVMWAMSNSSTGGSNFFDDFVIEHIV